MCIRLLFSSPALFFPFSLKFSLFSSLFSKVKITSDQGDDQQKKMFVLHVPGLRSRRQNWTEEWTLVLSGIVACICEVL